MILPFYKQIPNKTGERIVLNKARLPVITGVTTSPKTFMEEFQLFQNYPNPFATGITM